MDVLHYILLLLGLVGRGISQTVNVNSNDSLSLTKGPVHIFNGHEANFYLSTGQEGCSVDPVWHQPKMDADYFCSSFYGPDYISTSYVVGKYKESGNLGYQMHKVKDCISEGEDIEGTNCSGVKCKIIHLKHYNEFMLGYSGLYNIICLKNSEIKNQMIEQVDWWSKYNVWDDPSFLTDPLYTVNGVLGRNVKLLCFVGAGPENMNPYNKTISWIRRRDHHLLTVETDTYTTDKRFSANYHPSYRTEELSINSLKYEDAGEYVCQISSTPPANYRIDVLVFDSDSSLPVIDCGKVANDSDCIKNEKEFDVDNDCVGRSWFSKTDTSRVNAVQICKDHGYSGEILKYSANLGINCNYEVKYARQDGNLTDLGYRVVWKCEGNKYV